MTEKLTTSKTDELCQVKAYVFKFVEYFLYKIHVMGSFYAYKIECR